MVAPGDPELAADLARRAASVSHDGEAIYGAQVIAAMEAQAFVENDIQKLIDTALRFIPSSSIIYRLIAEIREWHASEPDWRKTREQIAANYGYDKYGGNCHMVPNHALIILALLYGDDDFQKSLMIVNTCGWDTDCNSGNVGCLMGIKNGLAGIDAGPRLARPGRRPHVPGHRRRRPRHHRRRRRDHPHRQQRPRPRRPAAHRPQGRRALPLRSARRRPGLYARRQPRGARRRHRRERRRPQPGRCSRSLALRYGSLAPGRAARVATPTFIPSRQVSDYFAKRGYNLYASPTLYAGQTLPAALAADAANAAPVCAGLYISVYNAADELVLVRGPQVELAARRRASSSPGRCPPPTACPSPPSASS